MQPKHKQKSTLLEECPWHGRGRPRVTAAYDLKDKNHGALAFCACALLTRRPGCQKSKKTCKLYGERGSPAENVDLLGRILQWDQAVLLCLSLSPCFQA